MTNVETVQKIYADFGRGDVPAILGRLADFVEWEYGAAPNDVPWLQPRRGKDEVMGFFESLAALEFHKFEPETLVEGSGLVIALINIEATVRASGQRIAEEHEVHIWHFDAAGQVVRFRHAADTHQHVMAFRG